MLSDKLKNAMVDVIRCVWNRSYCFHRCILCGAYRLDNKIIRPRADNYKAQFRQEHARDKPCIFLPYK